MSTLLTRNLASAMFLTALLASAASAATETVIGGQIPLASKVTKVTNVTGTVSATVDFCGRPARVLDNARGEYAGVYPLGAGGSMDICPNPILDMTLPNAHVVAMAAVSGDTMPSYLWDKKRGIGSFCGPNVTNLEFDGKRFHHRIPLDVGMGIGTQNFKYCGLIAGGQRDDHTMVILIHWPDTKELARLVDTFRFMTVMWPANVVTPSFVAFCQFLEEAGCGGVRADIYDRLIERRAGNAVQQSIPMQNGQEMPPGQPSQEGMVAGALDRNAETVASLQKVIDALVANDTSLKGAVEALSDQMVAVNADLQQTKQDMASAKDLSLVVNRLNELSQTVATLVAKVEAIERWHSQVSGATSAASPPTWVMVDYPEGSGKYISITALIDCMTIETSYGSLGAAPLVTLRRGETWRVKFTRKSGELIVDARVTIRGGGAKAVFGPSGRIVGGTQ